MKGLILAAISPLFLLRVYKRDFVNDYVSFAFICIKTRLDQPTLQMMFFVLFRLTTATPSCGDNSV